MIFVMIIAVYSVDLRKHRWNKRFWSPERKRLRDVARELR
jgi:hypothetical protein